MSLVKSNIEIEKDYDLKIVHIFLISGKDYVMYSKGETGWWYDNGLILVFTEGLSRLQILGVAIHETIEYLLESKLKFRHWVAHFIANIFEFCFSLGQGDIEWRIYKDG